MTLGKSIAHGDQANSQVDIIKAAIKLPPSVKWFLMRTLVTTSPRVNLETIHGRPGIPAGCCWTGTITSASLVRQRQLYLSC